MELLERMTATMVVDHDIADYRSIIESIGMLKAGTSFTDAEIEDYIGHFYAFALKDEVSTVTPEYASQTVRRFFDAGGPHATIMNAAHVPHTFVLPQSHNLGIYSILCQIRAT